MRRTSPLLSRGVAWIACVALAASTAWGESPRPEEFAARDRWVADHLAKPDSVAPFSFRRDGKPSDVLLRSWRSEDASRPLDADRVEITRTRVDPSTGLTVRLVAVVYNDFPTVEWTVWFENAGAVDSPLLEDVQGLDGSFEGEGPATLHHARGSISTEGDYEPFATPLEVGSAQRFGGSMGRPSGEHWPYFNLERDGRGVIVVVGWPGQWAGSFEADAAGAVRVRAGQELVRARLRPGESIRSPLMALQFWTGDVERSQNIWRRWMIRHGMPRPGGSPPPPQFVAASSRAYGEMVHADEASQFMFIDRYLEEGIKLDAWWMDAGWYKLKNNWPETGTWEVDPKRFPRGLRAITDHAHARGLRSIVWFEPERVAPGTRLYEEHPEWLLTRHGPAGKAPIGLRAWSSSTLGVDPVVTANLSAEPRGVATFSVPGGSLLEHPGPGGEFCVIRWTAPETGKVAIRARFRPADPKATTDVHVLVAGRSVFDGRVEKDLPEPSFEGEATVAKGETVDLVVGHGGNGHAFDSTYVEASIGGNDPAAEFGADANPAGVWSYGWLKPGPEIDAASFARFDHLRKPDENGDRILNLGDPRALAWLIGHVSRLIDEQGIDLYRQDFNIEPLPFWRAADAPDRQGLTENHHVVGYLAYWDALIARRPGLLIDSCASGGRRNDLETMRRAVPLWRTDHAFQATADQAMTFGLSTWLPYFGAGTNADLNPTYMGSGPSAVNPYAFWSNAAPSISCGVDVRERGIDYKALRDLVNQWRELSRFYYDDFHRLTPYSVAPNAWIAWQYNSPERGESAVQAFRRPEAEADSITGQLRGLDPDATYALSTFDAPNFRRATGRELAEGLEVAIPQKPGAAVILLRKE